MTHRVAITTRDGKVIQEHFGHAHQFHIVEIDGDGYKYLEARELEPRCSGETPDQTPHDASRFDPVIELLGDCTAILTAQIGPGASEAVIAGGLRIFEARGFIDDVLKELIDGKLLDTPAAELKDGSDK